MTQHDHARVKEVMGTLSPHVLSVLAMKDNSAAIRKHAKDALVKQIERRHGL